MKDLVKVHTDSLINVNRLAEILNNNEIPSLVKNSSESARLAGFGTVSDSVDLFVDGDNVEQAMEVIQKNLN